MPAAAETLPLLISTTGALIVLNPLEFVVVAVPVTDPVSR